MRILIAEDDPKLLKTLVHIFDLNNYATDGVDNGVDAFDYASSGEYDGLVLDIMMPGMDGVSLLKKLRGKGITTPALFLTARTEIDQRIEGLDAGADDYLPKPFAIEELLARIRSLLRRKNAWGSETPSPKTGSTQDEELLFFRNITLNPKSREVSLDGQLLSLTKTEYQLLFCLMSHKNEALSRERIMDMVWGLQHYIDPNSVDVYVRYLRNKLDVAGKESCITTLRGIGYIMKENS